ncbi:transcriptional regulator, TetR family [Singulisphaera sp. GP187]|uniref:TetR/AcrR family transcriptional regulator n=1 Tax=Singulisphaera sp. GP187 TaxID=1882752 RepID=UPI00092C1480|nr:TetR/AcrR family transcriptional regulator [Singulisphaera sp. GP187]SIO02909.1 transcriptional regulator, TetR family [Singulisphaera sp. GP187]
MPKPSHREKLLQAGFEVVLERGYCGASVRDIAQAAGAPQGSFTNHFASKDAFCLELLNRYFAMVEENIRLTLRNDAASPFARLEEWLDIQIRFLNKAGMRNGCLIGNFSAEAGEHSEPIRQRLNEIYCEIHRSVAYCLEAAVKVGELHVLADCDELAHFLYAALHGAILQAKVEHSPVPLERFKKTLFAVVLRPDPPR